MVIIGIDPGIARTGYGIIDTKSTALLVNCGCITTPENITEEERLVMLNQDLTTLLDTIPVTHAAVETIYFGTNAKTAIRTAQARGVILFTLRQRGIHIAELTPLQIKSQLTGYGQATKEQIQSTLVQRLKLNQPPQPDDAADALAAALCVSDKSFNNIQSQSI